MKLEPLLDGLSFGEGPRWRDDRLYFSDFYVHQVRTVDESGRTETIVEVPGQPSGLGWRPDGTMLIVSMTDRRLMRFAGGKLTVEAELGGIATGLCNDMIVDTRGRAYVGNFGFDRHAGEAASRPVTFGEVYSTLFRHLGIDTTQATINDLNGRPQYLVEDAARPIAELIS